MGRFYVVALLSVLTFAIAVIVSRVVGGVLSPLPADWLSIIATNPDGTVCGQICMFGIRPDDTDLEDALQLLKMHPFTRDMRRNASLSGFNDVYVEHDGLAVIINHDQDGQFYYVQLLTTPESDRQITAPQLGQAIMTLGNPDLVELARFDRVKVHRQLNTLYYFGAKLSVTYSGVPGNPLNANDRFDNAILWSSDSPALDLEDGVRQPFKGLAIPVRWRGFNSRYPIGHNYQFSGPDR